MIISAVSFLVLLSPATLLSENFNSQMKFINGKLVAMEEENLPQIFFWQGFAPKYQKTDQKHKSSICPIGGRSEGSVLISRKIFLACADRIARSEKKFREIDPFLAAAKSGWPTIIIDFLPNNDYYLNIGIFKKRPAAKPSLPPRRRNLSQRRKILYELGTN